jgi:hypothetical protein
MSFFKSKIEREMMQQMQRDEQMQVFTEQINGLKIKRQEYAKIAAEAEINADNSTYNIAVNALIELNDVISSLIQTKANFDIINISNSIATNMAMAVNALDSMANGKNRMPDIRKISKTSIKVKKYIKQIQFSQKTMSRLMNTSNPANRARSNEEITSVRPMIDAEISRMVGGSAAALKKQAASGETADNFDLSAEILNEKNRII